MAKKLKKLETEQIKTLQAQRMCYMCVFSILCCFVLLFIVSIVLGIAFWIFA
jgi:hypothetical protein